MRERIGIALALIEDACTALLDSANTGYFLICVVWLLAGIILGVQLTR